MGKDEYIILNERTQQMFRMVKGQIFLVDSSIKVMENTQQIVFFVGDSAMTAHYRLGIGINTILDGWALYNELFRTIQEKEYTLNGIAAEMDDRLWYKVLFQTNVIWLESICNFVVFFGFDEPLDRDNMKLYFRNHAIKDYDSLTEDQITELVDKCLSETVD